MNGTAGARPLFSVVMPVYNGGGLLAEALDSLRAQEPFDGGFEIVAADNGSTDGSRERLEAAAADLPIRTVDGAMNGNWVSSTNKAMGLVRGVYTAFLHHDDRFRPGRLRALAAAVRANPDATLFVNDTAFAGTDGKILGTWRLPVRPGRRTAAEVLPALLVQNNVAVPGAAFRTDAARALGGMDENLRYTADWDFWLRFAARDGLVRIAETLSEFRVHGGSQTVDFARRQTEMRDNMDCVVERFLPALEGVVPDARRRRRVRRLARLGVETDMFLAAAGTGAPLPWRAFFAAAFRCTPADWVRYAGVSAVVPRAAARIRAGFLSGRFRRRRGA